MKNIVLIGFMGTGKSVVGQRLAEDMGVQFVDTDQLIEKKEGLPVFEIFRRYGEGKFRSRERDVIREVSLASQSVIATGGGAVMDRENVKNLKRRGILICLTATPDVIVTRIGPVEQRPLLRREDPISSVKELLAIRQPYYALAELTIDTSERTVDDVVTIIRRKLKEASYGQGGG